MREDFQSAFLKVERAEHHIHQFELIVRTYISANLKAMRPVPNPYRRKRRAVGGRIPRHTATMVGDAIHNLRTSLDHAYCALVEANGGAVNRHTTFPFHKRRIDAKASLNGHVKLGIAPSGPVIDAILDRIEPFEDIPGGLYGVHALDIADKHHSLIAASADMDIERLEIEGPEGRTLVINNLTLVTNDPYKDAAIGFQEGYGAKLYGDPAKTFEIRFADGQPFAGESIRKTLAALTVSVKDALAILAAL